MTKLRHMAASFMVVGVLVALMVGIWGGFREGYTVTETNRDDQGRTVMENLNNLGLVQGLSDIADSIEAITAPSNVFDLLGALASAGIGVVKTIGGVVTFVPEILGIITNFYPNGIPSIVTVFIGALVVLYVAFILLKTYVKSEDI